MVPQEKIGMASRFTAEEFNAINWWTDRQPPEDYRKQFSAVLADVDCPYEGRLWWGTSSGNNIEVLVENDIVEDILIRSNCRQFDPAFSLRILAALAAEGGV